MYVLKTKQTHVRMHMQRMRTRSRTKYGPHRSDCHNFIGDKKGICVHIVYVLYTKT